MKKINNVDDAINIFLDDVDCNLKQKSYITCLKELDKKWFFRKRKFKQCDSIFKEYQHCVTYANENKLYKRVNYNTAFDKAEIQKKIIDSKLENRKDALNYLQGNITAEDYKKKDDSSNVRKKIIEL